MDFDPRDYAGVRARDDDVYDERGRLYELSGEATLVYLEGAKRIMSADLRVPEHDRAEMLQALDVIAKTLRG